MWMKEYRGRYDRSRLRYPSDLTDEEWALVEPLIAPAKRGGNKRTVDVREVVIGLMWASIRCGANAAVLFASDLIEHDGDDLRDLPLIDRKRRLAELIGKAKRAVTRDGQTAFPKNWSLRDMLALSA